MISDDPGTRTNGAILVLSSIGVVTFRAIVCDSIVFVLTGVNKLTNCDSHFYRYGKTKNRAVRHR